MADDRPSSHHRPGAGIWLLAVIALVLPWIGVPMALAGALLALRGWSEGPVLLAGGSALLVLDVAIDVVWSRVAMPRTDIPDLNRRGERMVGTLVTVTEPIVAGRGRVRAGDTVWLAEGLDGPAGEVRKVVRVEDCVLILTSAVASPAPQATPTRSRS